MTIKLVTLPSGTVIRIRPYRPDDREQVIHIFTEGMIGLAPMGTGHIIRKNRQLQVLTCAASAAALLAIPRRFGLLTKAAACLSVGAFMPCFVYGMIRRAMKRYVMRCVNGPDLSNIETFYSTAGAGHGSAFWVAELVNLDFNSNPTASCIGQATSLPPRVQRFTLSASSRIPSAAASAEADAGISPYLKSTELIMEAPATDVRDVTPALARTDINAVPCDPASTSALTREHDATIPSASSVPSSTDCCSSATAPVQEAVEEQQVRKLVAGLVTSAIARFEAAPGPVLLPELRPKSVSAPTPLHLSAFAAFTVDSASPVKEYHGKGGQGNPAILLEKSSASSNRAAPTQERKKDLLAPPVVDERQARVESLQPTPPPKRAPLQPVSRPPGTIRHVALERKSWKLAEVRRMSVQRRYSGQGVGQHLLETLVGHARDVGFQELMLQTSGMQPAARRLYERGGWVVSSVTEDHSINIYTYMLDLTKQRR